MIPAASGSGGQLPIGMGKAGLSRPDTNPLARGQKPVNNDGNGVSIRDANGEEV